MRPCRKSRSRDALRLHAMARRPSGAPDLIVFDASWHMPAAGRDARARISRRPHSRRGVLRHRRDRRSFDRPAAYAARTRSPSPRRCAGSASATGCAPSSMTASACSRRRACGGRCAPSASANVSILDGRPARLESRRPPARAGEAARAPAAPFTARFDQPRRRRRRGEGGARRRLARRSWTCARPSAFAGRAPEPRPGLRAGHMPGALNLPFGNARRERAG